MPHGLHRAPSANGRPVQNGTTPRRKVVLVLEDHASVGGLIAGLLRQDGYRVLRAWDLPEAARLARGRRPDAVLLDLNLRYPSGVEALKDLAVLDVTRRVPVVVVAAHDPALTPDQQQQVAEVVVKPFDIDVMLNAVRKALGDPLVEVEPHHWDTQDNFLHGY